MSTHINLATTPIAPYLGVVDNMKRSWLSHCLALRLLTKTKKTGSLQKKKLFWLKSSAK